MGKGEAGQVTLRMEKRAGLGQGLGPGLHDCVAMQWRGNRGDGEIALG